MDDYEYLINFHVYLKESNKSQALTDHAEIVTRQEMLSEIMELTRDYYEHVKEYNYKQFCKELMERGIRFIPVNDRTTKAKWTKLFAASISKEDRKKVYFEQYRWHLFSYKLLNALTEDDARDAFNREPKTSVYLFEQHSKNAYLVENAHLFKAEDFDHDFIPFSDFYLFSPEGKWTYIHTHESYCGPYFYKLK
ncbi:MAG: DUF4275 family protein [Anaerotignum sp.]|nr:DUF4275 family protein [Anaerotignum sp.]